MSVLVRVCAKRAPLQVYLTPSAQTRQPFFLFFGVFRPKMGKKRIRRVLPGGSKPAFLRAARAYSSRKLQRTTHWALCSPTVAVTVVVPLPTAVTWPSASTVAMLSSAELQVTVGSVAFSGVTVAVSCCVPPTARRRQTLLSPPPRACTEPGWLLPVRGQDPDKHS